jgi:hypothetical protein
MAPAKKGTEEKKGHSAFKEAVTENIQSTFTSRSTECPSDTQRDPEIFHEGDGHSRCVH